MNHRLNCAALVLTLGIAVAARAGDSSHGAVVCQIRPYHDRPTMFLNGQPRFPMAFLSYYPQPARYRQMGEHGVHVYSLSLTLTDKWINRTTQRVRHNTPGIWRGPDDVDWAVVEASLREILQADPQAYIFPRIFCDSPAWWDAVHPEEVRSVAPDRPLRQSLSSKAWREETAAVLRRIVRSVADSPYGNRVIGYMIGVGDTEELADRDDFSPPAQRSFRRWIEARSGRNDATLAIPSATEQRTAVVGNFLDPERSRLVIDYRQFQAEETVDAAIALCRAVKEASGGRLMTGVFYGYTRILPDSGHLALRRLLDSDAVDFVSNPYSTGGPQSHLTVGNSDYRNFTEVDAVQKAGKLFYAETDLRTSLSRWISQTRPDIDPLGEYKHDGWLGPPTIADSRRLMKAVFAKVLIGGSANWWFDLWGGWYDDKQFGELFARMQAVGDASLQRPRQSVAQIAVVLDERAYRYLPAGVAQWGGRFAWIDAQLEQLGRVGAPYDFYLLDDLRNLDLSRYRMIVFLNAFALSDDDRQTIERRVMGENRWLLWLYAPGLIRDKLAVENVSSLLGMEFQMTASHAAAKIAVTLPEGTASYEGAAVAPFLSVKQGADVASGRTPEGELVVAEKAGPACRQVFVGMPPLPWAVLQHYARQAGVHLYGTSGEVVFANASYVAISTAEPGRRTLRLPKKAALRELLVLEEDHAAPLPSQAKTEFEIDGAAHACRLFEIVPL